MDDDAGGRDDGARRRQRLDADDRERLAEEREVIADRRDDDDAEVERRLRRLANDRHGNLLAELDLNAVERRASTDGRVERPPSARPTVPPDGSPWSGDREDFVAAGRQETADRREADADRREMLADAREALLSRLATEVSGLLDDPFGGAAGREAAEDRAVARANRVTAAARRASADLDRVDRSDRGPLAAELVSISRILLRSHSVDDALRDVLDAVAATVQGCDYASVTRFDRDGFVTISSTDGEASRADDAQYAAGEGPCVDAVRAQVAVGTGDVTSDPRWPALGGRITDVLVRSVLSCGLQGDVVSGPLESINSYSASVEAFDRRSVESLVLLCAHTGVLTALAREAHSADEESEHLRRAVQTRDVIGQAKGILMERHRLTADEAFDVLRRSSQELNRKLRDVAEELALAGELPGKPPALNERAGALRNPGPRSSR